MHSIHPPRKKYSGRVHLPHNTMIQNQISETVLIETEVWHQVKKPYISQGIIIADNGYSWVKKWQIGANYCMRKTFNDKKELVAIYVDICSPVTKSRGQYGFVDWYLDVWVDLINQKQPILLDEDEFILALHANYLSKAEEQTTRSTAEFVMNALKQRISL